MKNRTRLFASLIGVGIALAQFTVLFVFDVEMASWRETAVLVPGGMLSQLAYRLELVSPHDPTLLVLLLLMFVVNVVFYKSVSFWIASIIRRRKLCGDPSESVTP